MSKPKRQKLNIDGVILLDKPQGITSNAALQKVRWLFNAKKAGHTGSLDPLATGVLPICFGQGTKFSQLLLDADKVYLAKAKLGVITDSSDTDGQVLEEKDYSFVTKEAVDEVLDKFRGDIEQVPSMFSALKHNGVPLYELARKGITVERPARKITIHSLELKDFDLENGELTLLVHCSKGTYIRNLVEDIGNALGCGACVSFLRRVKTGNFEIENCYTLEEIEKLVDLGQQETIIKDISCLAESHSKVYLSDEHAATLLKGQKLFLPALIENDDITSIGFWHQSLGFLGVGSIADRATGQVISKRLISTADV